MVGWSFGALVAGGFLVLGGPQIGILLSERGPTSLSCEAFLQARTRARWVRLSDCAPDWNGAREFQDRRFRTALYVPLGSSNTPNRSATLLARVDPSADRSATTWAGLIDVGITDKRPPFAASAARILYVDRPDPWEVFISIAVPFLYVAAAGVALKRRARRKVAVRKLSERFHPKRDALPPDLHVLNLDPLLDARRTLMWLRRVTLGALTVLVVVAVLSLGTSVNPVLLAIVTLVFGACVWATSVFAWKRSATTQRLVLIGSLAFGLAVVFVVLTVASPPKAIGDVLIALGCSAGLLVLAFMAMSMRRRLRLHPEWPVLAGVDIGVTRVRALRVPRHESLRRRPDAIVFYKSAAVAIFAVGAMVSLLIRVKPIAWVAGGFAVLLWRRARRHATLDAHEVMERDPRPPVVLLRSFADDELEVGGLPEFVWSPPTTMSWVAAEKLASIGPVVAVGEPDEALPPLGPYRVFLPAGDWHVEVERLMSSARAVFLVLGRSKGVLWELEHVLAREPARGATVIVPPAEPADLEQRWEAFLALAKRHKVWALAEHLDPTSLLLVHALDDRSALALSATRPNGAAYALAFGVCAAIEAGLVALARSDAQGARCLVLGAAPAAAASERSESSRSERGVGPRER
jgi:hypothetical protein